MIFDNEIQVKEQQRAKIQADIELYLAKGGKIEKPETIVWTPSKIKLGASWKISQKKHHENYLAEQKEK